MNVSKTINILMFVIFMERILTPICSLFSTVPKLLQMNECTLFGSSSNYAMSIHCLFYPPPSLLVDNTLTELHQVIARKLACSIPGLMRKAIVLLSPGFQHLFAQLQRLCFLWERMLYAMTSPALSPALKMAFPWINALQ